MQSTTTKRDLVESLLLKLCQFCLLCVLVCETSKMNIRFNVNIGTNNEILLREQRWCSCESAHLAPTSGRFTSWTQRHVVLVLVPRVFNFINSSAVMTCKIFTIKVFNLAESRILSTPKISHLARWLNLFVIF